MATIEEFAAKLEREQRDSLARRYPDLAARDEIANSPAGSTSQGHYRSSIAIGPKYTRVDFGGSGKYMVVNATGEIFGIKGYGVIHRGHPYGTLETIDQWDWSEYYPRRIKVTA